MTSKQASHRRYPRVRRCAGVRPTAGDNAGDSGGLIPASAAAVADGGRRCAGVAERPAAATAAALAARVELGRAGDAAVAAALAGLAGGGFIDGAAMARADVVAVEDSLPAPVTDELLAGGNGMPRRGRLARRGMSEKKTVRTKHAYWQQGRGFRGRHCRERGWVDGVNGPYGEAKMGYNQRSRRCRDDTGQPPKAVPYVCSLKILQVLGAAFPPTNIRGC